MRRFIEQNPTHVYIIGRVKAGRVLAPVKIGVSANPHVRIEGFQTVSPFPLATYCTIKIPDRESAYNLERNLHAMFADFQMHGEWFRVSPDSVIEGLTDYLAKFFNRLVDEHGWTGDQLRDLWSYMDVREYA